MKKNLLILLLLLLTVPLWAQQVQITESSGWLESAFVKWQPVSNAQTYNVYYSGNGVTDKKIDDQLIRSYGSYFRADIPGLKAGSYAVKIKPVISGAEGTGSTTGSLTVAAQDRNGFAFEGGRVPGGYKADGTPKDNAVILYITQNTKNTISMNITGASANPCVGLQNILYAIKKGKDTRPFIIRLIGNITDMTVMEGGDVVIENANNASSYVTFEGIGDDARAGLQGQQARAQRQVHLGQQVHRDHGRRREVGLEKVLLAELGAGELLVNSIDADGTRDGFDIELLELVRSVSRVPVIASGGAGQASDFPAAAASGADAILAASVFHEGSITITQAKQALRESGYEVR